MKNVLLLDDDQDLCFILKELLIQLGVSKCEFIHSVKDLKLIKNLDDFEIALLDVNLGENEPSGLDGYAWLIDKGFKGKVVFFTGHARTHPLVEKALTYPNVLLLEKPVSVQGFEELLS